MIFISIRIFVLLLLLFKPEPIVCIPIGGKNGTKITRYTDECASLNSDGSSGYDADSDDISLSDSQSEADHVPFEVPYKFRNSRVQYGGRFHSGVRTVPSSPLGTIHEDHCRIFETQLEFALKRKATRAWPESELNSSDEESTDSDSWNSQANGAYFFFHKGMPWYPVRRASVESDTKVTIESRPMILIRRFSAGELTTPTSEPAYLFDSVLHQLRSYENSFMGSNIMSTSSVGNSITNSPAQQNYLNLKNLALSGDAKVPEDLASSQEYEWVVPRSGGDNASI